MWRWALWTRTWTLRIRVWIMWICHKISGYHDFIILRFDQDCLRLPTQRLCRRLVHLESSLFLSTVLSSSKSSSVLGTILCPSYCCLSLTKVYAPRLFRTKSCQLDYQFSCSYFYILSFTKVVLSQLSRHGCIEFPRPIYSDVAAPERKKTRLTPPPMI